MPGRRLWSGVSLDGACGVGGLAAGFAHARADAHDGAHERQALTVKVDARQTDEFAAAPAGVRRQPEPR